MPSSPSADRLRIALVIPRFARGIVGGAELHARMLTEHLAEAGHDVEVLTTCAVDHHTWRNELPAGAERDGALTVRRFPADARDHGIHGELERGITLGMDLSREEELLWLRHGVSSAAMEDDLRARGDRYDLIVAMPYLFGTTYFAYAARPERTVVVPCLHDEPYAHRSIVREMLEGARGVMFNAPAEAALGRTLAPDIARWTVVGVGFDEPGPSDEAAFRRAHKLRDPYLLSIGRREGGKNWPLLVDHFRRFKHRHPSSLKLVVVGSGDPVPSDPDFVELKLDWRRIDLHRDTRERDALYRGALAICIPSTNESLSMILMQAWLCERPAIVHAHCDVTRDHCERSDGGLWFGNYAEFEAILERYLSDPSLCTALGRNGRGYVRREYAWPAVLARFEEAAGRWLAEGVPA